LRHLDIGRGPGERREEPRPPDSWESWDVGTTGQPAKAGSAPGVGDAKG
jgi:hypothetical protein